MVYRDHSVPPLIRLRSPLCTCLASVRQPAGLGFQLVGVVWMPLVWVLQGRLFLSSYPLIQAFLPLPSQASLVAAMFVIWCSLGLGENSQELGPSPLGLQALGKLLGISEWERTVGWGEGEAIEGESR